MTKLSDYGIIKQVPNLVNLEDIQGQKVTLVGMVKGPGRYGEQYYIALQNDKKHSMTVAVNNPIIMQALDEVQAAKAWPVDAIFIKHSGTWTVE